jgi:hypothetical protein
MVQIIGPSKIMYVAAETPAEKEHWLATMDASIEFFSKPESM